MPGIFVSSELSSAANPASKLIRIETIRSTFVSFLSGPLLVELAGFQQITGVNEMPLVTVVLTLLVVGVLLWLVNRFIPMQSQIKGILNAVVVIAVVLWLLKVFGLFGYITQFRVGH
jgi:hypothetical protein